MSDWILIVDDNPVNIKSAGMILSKAGYHVAGMKSGSRMMEYVKTKGAPGLILLDILMPDMDGFETCEALRSYEKENAMPQTPVIFLSAEENPETQDRCKQAGALGFLQKPLAAESLIEAVKKVL